VWVLKVRTDLTAGERGVSIYEVNSIKENGSSEIKQ
jgi:hypothetical protein